MWWGVLWFGMSVRRDGFSAGGYGSGNGGIGRLKNRRSREGYNRAIGRAGKISTFQFGESA